MTVGERICKYRKLEGLTQEELALKLGTSPQNIYKYENNVVKNIPLRSIEKAAEIFGIPPTVLVGWEPESEDSQPSDVWYEVYTMISRMGQEKADEWGKIVLSIIEKADMIASIPPAKVEEILDFAFRLLSE